MNRNALYDEVLPKVTKPSRYLGTEFNTVHKEPRDVELRIGLVFPDLYELGLGNLGLHILYAILNDLPWCWAERAYAPAPDMEAELRARGFRLFALESKAPLSEMDMLGFSLQSELTYTSVLNILDLAGVPLRADARDNTHPLVFAGGPTAVNPEPLAPFIDFFVIGDGEVAMVEIAELCRALRGRPRDERLAEIAKVSGVYVPSHYSVERLPDGRVLPQEGQPDVVRRVITDLDKAQFPTRYIVPFTQLIHDRLGLEVLRGCTHGCRFCQAGIIGRPVRARTLGNIDTLVDELLDHTGYEEISLVSLSTCDYPRARTLLEQSVKRARPDRVAVSLPSVRLDTFSVELADMVAGVRRSGLTFAPEAATPRLRAVINKWFDDQQLFDVIREAFGRGWTHVKCYFMIGLPTETDEDVEAIVDLCGRIVRQCRPVDRNAQVFTGISTFVPKPFTPFQWSAQIGIEEIRRRQRILEKGFKQYREIKFGRHEPESTMIEGLIARSDRRAADLIETAFRRGARLDSSGEYLNWDAWSAAIEETGFDVDGALRARSLDERLPWDHIDVMIPKAWFRREYELAIEQNLTKDCREAGCQGCGLGKRIPGLCAAMRAEIRKAKEEQRDSSPLPPTPSFVEPAPVQRLRFRVGREGESRFLSHLEWMNAWIRALRRAHVPLSHSQGFHAHPKITFATAPPVGEESEADYMDVVLTESVDPLQLLSKLEGLLPMGFRVYEACEVPLNAPSLMSSVIGFDYRIETSGEACEIQRRIENLLGQTSVEKERKGRPEGRRKSGKSRTLDIRPMIRVLSAREGEEGRVAIDFGTTAVEGRMAKPKDIIELLDLDPASARVIKHATHLAERA